jgi:hypothetical protein
VNYGLRVTEGPDADTGGRGYYYQPGEYELTNNQTTADLIDTPCLSEENDA